MKSALFFVAIASPLIALAELGDSPLSAVVRKLPGSSLHTRSGIDTFTIPNECQSQCTPIITTLDV